MAPEERACEGVFMAFQYPVEIAGVNNAYFLKAALNAVRKHRGAARSSTPSSSCSSSREKAKLLEMDQAMLSRSVNEGFSGGEKKRNEIFQMAVLEPRLAILDETDSGLDIDALKIVAERRQRAPQPRPRHHRRHALSAAAQLHRAGLRARAVGRPHRAVRRQGAGARARRQGLRLDRGRDGGSEGVAMTQVAERTDSLSTAFERLPPRRGVRRGRPRRHARGGVRPLPGAGVPDDARRGVALHERRADRAHGRSSRAGPCRRCRPPRLEPFLFAGDMPHRVVLVNGRWSPALSSVASLPAGVTVRSLRDVLAAPSPVLRGSLAADEHGRTPFVDLNTAFFEDGVVHRGRAEGGHHRAAARRVAVGARAARRDGRARAS